MKLSILIAGLVLFTGNAAFAAKCTQAQLDKGGESQDMNDGGVFGSYFTTKEPKWICVMPSKSEGYIYISPKHDEKDEE